MRALIFIYIVSFSSFACADYAQKILKAKSASEIRSLQQLHEELQIARRACKLQLQNKSAPLACYESLELEKRWGLHQPGGERRLREKLDRLCAEAAQRLQVSRHIPARDVSLGCRREIEQAQRILSYRENRPEWSEN